MSGSSIRRKLVLPVIVLVIGVSVAIGWVSTKAGMDAVQILTERLLADVVNRINVAVERHLDGAMIALEAVAPSAENIPEEQSFNIDMSVLERKLWTASGLFMTVNNYVYFGGEDGRFVGVYRLSSDNVQVFWRKPNTSVREVFKAKIPGVHDELIRTDAFDPRKRPWYQSVKGIDTPQWSKIYPNFSFHYPTITLSKSVYQAGHKFVGVLATDVTLKELSAFLSRLGLSKNSVAYIVDEDGYVIASSGAELPERNVNGIPVRLSPADMKTVLIKETAKFSKDKNLNSASSQSIQTSIGMVEVAVSAMGKNQGLNWTTVVAIPRADFMSGINQGFYQSVGIAIACIVIALMIGLGVIDKIIRDIQKLTREAKRFGDGEPLTDMQISRNDEIGILAQTFVEMERKLRFDKLTQVANREFLFAQITYLQKRAKLDPEIGYTLLFLDLDRFKIINDQWGHTAGDQVLVIIAARLRAMLRETDEVARYGGDEFVLLLKDKLSENFILQLVEEICTIIEQPIALESEVVRVEVSVGVSIGWANYPDDGKDYVQLIKVADSRMYHSKRDRKAEQLNLM